jgi:hypothetical protein
MDLKQRVRERVQALPHSIFDCEACETDNSMQIRRSSLNEQFLADDVGLKCMECWHYRTHGIPFNDPDTFQSELQARGTRVLDFTTDEHGQPDTENLKALGYIGASKQ